jgi:hypothetical protein
VSDYIGFVVLALILLGVILFARRRPGRAMESSPDPVIPKEPPVASLPRRTENVPAGAESNPAAAHGPGPDGRFRLGDEWIDNTADIPLIARVEQDAAAAAILDGSLEKWLRGPVGLRPVADLLMTIASAYKGDGPAALTAYLRAQIPPRHQHVIPVCPHCDRILPVAFHPRWPWKCAGCGHAHQTDNPVLQTCESCGQQADAAPCPHCGQPIDLDGVVRAMVPNQDEVDLPSGTFALCDFLREGQVRFSKVLTDRAPRPITQELADYIFNLSTGLVFKCSRPARSLLVVAGEVRYLPERSHLMCAVFDKTIEEISRLDAVPDPVGNFRIQCGGPMPPLRGDPMPRIE